MNALQISQDIVLEPADNNRLANLCGQFDEHLRQIERRLNIQIASRGNRFRVTGNAGATEIGGIVIRSLFKLAGRESLDPERVHICLQESVMNDAEKAERAHVNADDELIEIQTRRKLVRPRGVNQRLYLKSIRDSDLAFGIGPAGTGKTYLAVASAIDALENERITMPAVETVSEFREMPVQPRSEASLFARFSSWPDGNRSIRNAYTFACRNPL